MTGHVHAQSCPALCNLMDCSPPGSSVHGIFQARILEWVAISTSRCSFQPRDQTHISCVSCISRRMLYHWSAWEAKWEGVNAYFWISSSTSICWHFAAASKSLQSCPTLYDPIDGSPPGSLVPGTLQARTLEWVAISFSNTWKAGTLLKVKDS